MSRAGCSLSVFRNANKLATAGGSRVGAGSLENPLQFLALCVGNVVVGTQLGCRSRTIWITHKRHVSQIVHLTCFPVQMGVSHCALLHLKEVMFVYTPHPHHHHHPIKIHTILEVLFCAVFLMESVSLPTTRTFWPLPTPAESQCCPLIGWSTLLCLGK